MVAKCPFNGVLLVLLIYLFFSLQNIYIYIQLNLTAQYQRIKD